MNQFFNFRGGKISFIEKGKGDPLVLLHGFLSAKEAWGNVFSKLSGTHQVIAPDLPGHGESSCFGYIHSMELIAASVGALLDNMGIKKCAIAGHSMGGYAALAFAELFPERVQSLCLFHSTSYADTAEKKINRGRAVKAVKSSHNVYVRETVRGLFSEANLRSHKKEIRFAEELARGTPLRGIINSLEGMRIRPHRDHVLHYAKFPVLFIVGKHDTVIREKDVLEQASITKKSRVLTLEHSGHMGFLEEPEIAVQGMKEFF